MDKYYLNTVEISNTGKKFEIRTKNQETKSNRNHSETENKD